MQWLLNITYCLVVFECCFGAPVQVGGGRVFGLLPWEQRRAHSNICKHQMLPLFLSVSLSLLLLLHSSTLTSPLSVCQHFSSGGVRHGVRVPGLPAPASSHCDLQPATSALRANAAAGHYWALYWVDSLCQEERLFMLFGPFWVVMPTLVVEGSRTFSQQQKDFQQLI